MFGLGYFLHSVRLLLVGAGFVFVGITLTTTTYAEETKISAATTVENSETISEVANNQPHSKGGLPQLDFSTYPTQIFWALVTFSLMFAVFSRKILPDISSTLENRHERIQTDLDKANELKTEAETAQKTYEELLSVSHQKAMNMVQKADQDLKAKYNESMNEFRARAAAKNQETENEITVARKKAMGEMHEIAATIAIDAAKKIIGVDTDLKQAKSVVENIDKKAA